MNISKCCCEKIALSDGAWYGRLEEYHQKRGDYTMFEYYKRKRLEFEAEYAKKLNQKKMVESN